jgi:phytoene synthase
MAMDLTVTAYPTYQDLLGYMAGSAAAIGAMMLPILQAPARGLAVAGSAALGAARQLGLAFQLTNFIRDVAEDLDRGRVYLPMEDLDLFGVPVADLRVARAAGRSTRRIKDLIRYETRRARAHYAAAEIGIGLLEPSSRPCIRAAFTLYSGILDEVERGGDEVFAARAVVPAGRRLRLAAGALIHP